jgi:hypothetical protein
MTEILWNTNAPHSPVRDHELVELRLVDVDDRSGHHFLVREIHAAWSAAGQQIEWKGFKDWTFERSDEALQSFANRKASVVRAGFPYATTLN